MVSLLWKRDRFSVALYATKERSPNFGPIERGEKQTNNID